MGDRFRMMLATADRRAAAGFVGLGALLWYLSRWHGSLMPVWAPWDFSILWFAAFALIGWSYARGLAQVPQPGWRIGFFAAGALLIWAVLQTRYEYWALHLFVLNRVQHMVMHHLGPFLIALAWPWPTILAGLPADARRIAESRPVAATIRFMRQPEVAGFAFVGLLVLWLIPSIHFIAMLNPWLYQVMNWSMVLDGLMFWSLILDPRPPEEAGISYAARAVTGVIVMFPQIAIGATLCFAGRDLYAFYSWCGRLPLLGPLSDQRFGGVVVWESPSMMSVAALLLVLNAARRHEERLNAGKAAKGAVSSAAWTGR